MKWEKVKLGDIATFSNGINFNKTAYAKGIKLIGVSNFGDRFYPDYSQLQEVKKDIVRLEDCLRNGDIVFVRSNGNKELVGRCMLVKNPTERVTYSGFCIRARLNDTDRYDPVYFTYYFKSKAFRRAVSGTAVGANIQNLSQARLSNHECRIPSIEVQHRIADILSVYDDLIENNQKQIKLLEEAAQRLYKEWFVDLRFPGHENTKIVDGVPEGWQYEKLGNLVKTTSGGTPSRRKSEYYVNGNIRWIKTKELNDRFIFETEEHITEDAVKNSSAKVLPEGALIVAMYGATIGKIGITAAEMACNQACCAFISFDDMISKEYLYCWLMDNREYLVSQGKGAAQSNLSQEMIRNFSLLCPDKKVIKNFTEIVTTMLENKRVLENKILMLSKARDDLLPKLMSGEVEV